MNLINIGSSYPPALPIYPSPSAVPPTPPTPFGPPNLNLTFPPPITRPHPSGSPLSLTQFPHYFEALVSVAPADDTFRIGIGVISSAAIIDSWDSEGRVQISYRRWWVNDLFSFSHYFPKSSSNSSTSRQGSIPFGTGYLNTGELSLYPRHFPTSSSTPSTDSSKLKKWFGFQKKETTQSIIYVNNGKYLPRFTSGDVIGVGWEKSFKDSQQDTRETVISRNENGESLESIYFTKNGMLLARCFIPSSSSSSSSSSTQSQSQSQSQSTTSTDHERFLPFFVTDTPCQLLVNFGRDPFLYIPPQALQNNISSRDTVVTSRSNGFHSPSLHISHAPSNTTAIGSRSHTSSTCAPSTSTRIVMSSNSQPTITPAILPLHTSNEIHHPSMSEMNSSRTSSSQPQQQQQQQQHFPPLPPLSPSLSLRARSIDPSWDPKTPSSIYPGFSLTDNVHDSTIPPTDSRSMTLQNTSINDLEQNMDNNNYNNEDRRRRDHNSGNTFSNPCDIDDHHSRGHCSYDIREREENQILDSYFPPHPPRTN